jgi:hypothetical protein
MESVKIEKPDATGISQFLEDNRGDTTDQEFVERYIKGVIETLKKNKKLYRSFGGYWWPLKRLIMAQDDSAGVGTEYNTELNDTFSYASDALTVSAAYLIQQSNIEQGYMHANNHTYYTSSQEPIDVMIEDTEMEAQIFAESFV